MHFDDVLPRDATRRAAWCRNSQDLCSLSVCLSVRPSVRPSWSGIESWTSKLIVKILSLCIW